jgi:membrane-anchored protein YejM (alkaline phosphatase superfamily)
VPDNQAVVVQPRACRDCGTVFSPAVSPLLVLVTIPLALVISSFIVWGLFVNDRADQGTVDALVWVAFLFVLCLVFATVQILRQREPKIHESPPKVREPKPWDNPRGDADGR